MEQAMSSTPSAKKFAAALLELETQGGLSETDRQMLTRNYNSPDQRLTTSEMSALMGWSGHAANGPYGKLGKRLAEALNWIPKEREGLEGFHVSAIVLGDRETGAFEWKMRVEVARALELLRWPGLQRSGTDAGPSGIVEEKRYRWQRMLERNSAGADFAKRHHKYRCEACLMSFADTYGDIGENFIEAHHLVPLSELDPSEPRIYTAADFAVLCSNCHRMIHRWTDPADVIGFRDMLKKRRAI
jgi:predicted HNH restriction endonuclease